MIHNTVKELVRDALSTIEQARKQGSTTNIPTGLVMFDKETNGFKAGEFIIIGSRPGMGKSALVYSMVLKQSVYFKIPVALFTLENAAHEVVMRLIAIESGVNYLSMTRGRLMDYEKERIDKISERLMNASLMIDETPMMEIEEFVERSTKYKEEQGVRIIYIDNLQQFRVKKSFNSKVDEYTYIADLLKKTSVKLGVAIAATAQLNRAVETRGGWKMPILSDLRESGALEQNADKVIFIYRPEYYHIDMFEDETSTANIAILNVAKNRFGPQALVKVRFNGKTGEFSDLSEAQAMASVDYNDINEDIPF